MQIQLIGLITIDSKPTKLGQNRLFQLLALNHPNPVDRDDLFFTTWEARILKNVRSSIKFDHELADVARWAVRCLKKII